MMIVALAAACVGVACAVGLGTLGRLAALAAAVWLMQCLVRQAINRFIVYRKIPSNPLMFPLLGHVLFAFKLKKWISQESQRHKQGVFLFWPAGAVPYVFVVNPKTAKHVLGDVTTFPKGPDYVNKFSSVFGNGLVTAVGPHHSRARRVLGRFFVKATLEAHVPAIRAETERFVASIVEPKLGSPFDVRDFFHLLTMQVFCRTQLHVDPVLHGTPDCFLDPRVFDMWREPGASHVKPGVFADWFASAYAAGQQRLSEHFLYSIPIWSFLPGTRRMLDLVKTAHNYFQAIIDHRRAQVAAGDDVPDDCLTALLREQADNADMPLSDREIKEQLVTLVGAGHDTTAYFLCYTVHSLAEHPHIQQALREELLSDTFDWPTSLLKRILQEILRFYAVIPQVSRTAARDAVIPTNGDDIVVPKGADLVIPMYASNRLASVWGDDAATFNPDRWIEHNKAAKSDGLMNSKLGFFPFGYGSRTCIGYNLSLVETRAILTQLLDRYEFVPAPGRLPPLFIGISLVVTDPRGIQVIFKERN